MQTQLEKSNLSAFDAIMESIVKDPEQLSKVCAPVTDLEAAWPIAEQLLTTCLMLDSGEKMSCVGIAANQIGFQERIIMVKVKGNYKAYINPRLIGGVQPVTSQEGCYSQPGKIARVKRLRKITVEADNASRHQLTGLTARAFQHELDHLNGILI
jgi:peptide deformylase